MKINSTTINRVIVFGIFALAIIIFNYFLGDINSYLFTKNFTDSKAKKIVISENFCIWAPSGCKYDKMQLRCTEDNFFLKIEKTNKIIDNLEKFKQFTSPTSYKSYIISPNELLYVGEKDSLKVFFNRGKNFNVSNIIINCNADFLLKP